MSPETTNETTPGIPRRTLLAALCAAGIAGGTVILATLGQVTAPETQSFRFARGASLAAGEEDRLRAYLLEAVRDDRIRVAIIGHSGTSGDPVANRQLSEDRATVAAGIAAALGIGADRVSVAGVGDSAPLGRPEGMADRAWQAELARVEVTLQVRR